jgi:hypothetical protein
MENTFDLKKFLVENKLTSNSRILNESSIGGINLDTVKALAKEPAMQKVQDQLKANPELAKKAIKLLGDVLSGKVDNEIEEAVNPNLDYGVRRVLKKGLFIQVFFRILRCQSVMYKYE